MLEGLNLNYPTQIYFSLEFLEKQSCSSPHEVREVFSKLLPQLEKFVLTSPLPRPPHETSLLKEGAVAPLHHIPCGHFERLDFNGIKIPDMSYL